MCDTQLKSGEYCTSPGEYWVQICKPDWDGRGRREGKPPKPQNRLACAKHLVGAIKSINGLIEPHAEVVTVKRRILRTRKVGREILDIEVWK